MLANLLPGFRHTRTPFIAGSLWLLIAWLTFGAKLLPGPTGGRTESHLYELRGLLGDHVLLAALALAALLIGGMAPRVPLEAIALRLHINVAGFPNDAWLWAFGMQHGSDFSVRAGDFHNWLHRIGTIVPETLRWSEFTGPECPPDMQVWARDLSDEDLTAVGINGQMVSKDEVTGGVDGEGAAKAWLIWVLAPGSIETELSSELPMQLQIEREGLYNDYDRIVAESELRAAIIVPLTVLLGFLVAWSAYWALTFLLPLWLLRQAVQAHVEAEQRLRSAVRHGAIRSSTVEFMKFTGGRSQSSW